MARPTKFNEEMQRQATKLAEFGHTDKEIAEVLGVTEQTINNWKNDFPEFFESLKKAKDIADAKVVRSLFERATGYTHPDEHISNYQGSITITPIKKHYAPDPTSMIFWLKNRQPNEWREKKEVEHSGELDINVKQDIENAAKALKEFDDE
jgi:DNA-binding XRE family transcriptional regulator